MLVLALFALFGMVYSEESNSNGQTSILRDKRQTYYYYYICGSFPNQYVSYTPCNQNNNNNRCNTECRTNQYCQSINRNWRCVNGCCKNSNNGGGQQPQQPVCGGRETSAGYCGRGASCRSGFLCTSNNVCCRCAYGTSIGPCVNGQCPSGTRCNGNNQCCPYQV